jgi:hypothetical protein
MTRPVHRRAVLNAGLALCASIAVRPARACEFFAPNLRVYRPWARATAAGDEFAIVSMTIDQVTLADRLIGIETPVAEGADVGGIGARAQIDLAIGAGQELVLSEEGTHLRLLRLKHPLQLGCSYPMNLIFERAGVLIADIDVDYERIG